MWEESYERAPWRKKKQEESYGSAPWRQKNKCAWNAQDGIGTEKHKRRVVSRPMSHSASSAYRHGPDNVGGRSSSLTATAARRLASDAIKQKVYLATIDETEPDNERDYHAEILELRKKPTIH